MMSFNAFFAKNLVSQNGNERQFVQETKKVALLERHNPNSTGIMMINRSNTTCESQGKIPHVELLPHK